MAVREVIQTCVNCTRVAKLPNEYWYLNGYYGVTGIFCSGCYAMVKHDVDGRPHHPNEYIIVLLKQEKK